MKKKKKKVTVNMEKKLKKRLNMEKKLKKKNHQVKKQENGQQRILFHIANMTIAYSEGTNVFENALTRLRLTTS